MVTCSVVPSQAPPTPTLTTTACMPVIALAAIGSLCVPLLTQAHVTLGRSLHHAALDRLSPHHRLACFEANMAFAHQRGITPQHAHGTAAGAAAVPTACAGMAAAFLCACRNVTVSGLPGVVPTPMLDFQFKLSVAQLCNDCWFTFRDVNVKDERMVRGRCFSNSSAA
jgi:hypothetical protein